MKNTNFGFGKAVGMLFAVIIPAALVAYCNHLVFPESSYIAIGMVVVSVGVAGIFAVASGYATPKVRRYCLLSGLALSVVLSANLSAHWVLSREVSGARQATEVRHGEEDRAEARRKAQADDAVRLAQAQTQQLKMEAIRNDSAKRLGIAAPKGTRISSAAMNMPTISAAPPDGPRLTVEEVMKRWNGWLIWFAVADLLTSVVAFGVCAAMWEWDVNHDGIADHLQQSRELEEEFPKELSVRNPK